MKLVRAALIGTASGLAFVVACSTDETREPGAAPAGVDSGSFVADAPGEVVDASKGSDASKELDASDARLPIVVIPYGGHVEGDGALAGATVRVLSPPMVTTTDERGDFEFNLPLGAQVVIKVEPNNPKYLPMIRGLVINPPNRPRTWFLTGPNELAAFQSLGNTVDLTKALVQVDFRNAKQGGYSVTMTSGGSTLTAGWGAALDAADVPQSTMMTLTGKHGSTLYLGNVSAPNDVSFEPHIGDAGLPCKPCDGPTLPIEPGVSTWYDFECGVATDCL